MRRKGYALLAAFTIGGLALAAGATAAHERSAVASGSARLLAHGAEITFSSWSPDGNQIAFVSDRTGLPQIWSIGADGSGLRQITSVSTPAIAPDWSPDGARIVFEGGSGEDGFIDVVELADGRVRRLTNTRQDYGPDWSPDGQWIAFTSMRDLHGQIYVMRADGSEPRRVTTEVGEEDFHPDWSPDGTQIAFTGGDDESGYIDVVNADGTNRRRLTGGGNEYQPAWSPDGTRIAFTAELSAD